MVCRLERQTETFGLQAESWIVELLTQAGFQVIRATEEEDKKFKVDFWVARNNRWLAIQFSVNRHEIINGKGIDALRRGIVPSWLDGQELEQAARGQSEAQKRLLTQFWSQVEAAVAARPELPVRRPAVTALSGR